MEVVVTKKSDVIKSVPARWKSQYYDEYDGEWHINYTSTSTFSVFGKKGRGWRFNTFEDIYNELIGLDLDTSTEEDIAEIIGNGSWTRQVCDSCKSDVPVIFGLESVGLCEDCLDKMNTELLKYKEL